MTGKPPGNILAKQRKRQHEDSTLVFPKITNLTGDMILQHQLDDTYTKTSYSIQFDLKTLLDKPSSPRIKRGPPPQKDILSWQNQDGKGSEDSAKTGKKGFQYDRFETEYSSGYRYIPLSPTQKKDCSNSYRHVPYSPIQRQRLLNREEIAKFKLPDMDEVDTQEPSTPLPSPVLRNNQLNEERYADLNKFLGFDIFRDREVLAELLDSADKRYLIKLLRSLSSETLIGLKRWLLSRQEEEKENEDDDFTKCPPISSPTSPPSTPTKDQENASSEATMLSCREKRASPLFNKIFEKSPSEEKEVIRKLLNAGDYKYLEKFLSCVVQPEAVQGVRTWLVSHDGQDREVAIRFLGDIRKPLSRQLKETIKEEKARENVENALISGQSQILKRVREKKRPPHGSNCSCAICDTDCSNKILKALYKHGTSAVIDEMRKALEFVPRPKRTINRKQHSRKNQVAKLGGNRLGQDTINHTSYIANKGALFMQPHRAIPQYFVIHPEMT